MHLLIPSYSCWRCCLLVLQPAPQVAWEHPCLLLFSLPPLLLLLLLLCLQLLAVNPVPLMLWQSEAGRGCSEPELEPAAQDDVTAGADAVPTSHIICAFHTQGKTCAAFYSK